jgi:hypothetical protein
MASLMQAQVQDQDALNGRRHCRRRGVYRISVSIARGHDNYHWEMESVFLDTRDVLITTWQTNEPPKNHPFHFSLVTTQPQSIETKNRLLVEEKNRLPLIFDQVESS